MVRLLLATRNAHKTREFAEILGKDFEVSDLSSVRDAPEIKETGGSFEENAILKALAVSQRRSASGGLVVADDSGLDVDALNGTPRIYSARYAGENASDKANVDTLLRALSRQNLPASKRTARFRSRAVVLGSFQNWRKRSGAASISMRSSALT